MNEQRIREIKERLRATTPGAWKACFAIDERFDPDCPEEDPHIENEFGQFVAMTTYDTQSTTCRPTMYADTEFIAHAKEDIAWLLERLEIALRK